MAKDYATRRKQRENVIKSLVNNGKGHAWEPMHVHKNGAHQLHEAANGDEKFSLTSFIDPNLAPTSIEDINKLLANERLLARDAGGPLTLKIGDKMFQGASLLKGHGINKRTKKEEDFAILTVNMHVHDRKPTAHRCAESLAVGQALSYYEENGLTITECNFMGASSTLVANDPHPAYELENGEVGKRVKPCGNCADLLVAFGTDDTLYRIFPANDGSMKVEPDPTPANMDHGSEDLPPTALWGIEQRHVAGMKAYVPDDQERAREDAKKAMEYLQAPHKISALREALDRGQGRMTTAERFTRLREYGGWRKLDANEYRSNQMLHQMHQFMMEFASEQMQVEGRDVDRVTLAVVRTVDAEGNVDFHLGRHMMGKQDGRELQSNAPAIEGAINEISTSEFRETVTDIFFMDIEPKQLKAMAAGEMKVAIPAPSMGEGSVVAKAASRFANNLKKMADPDKYFYRDCARDMGSAVRIHLMTPMNPDMKLSGNEHFDPAVHVQTITMNDIIRHGGFAGKDADACCARAA